VASVTDATGVQLMAAEMLLPLKVTARCCQVPVPGAVTVPLARVVSVSPGATLLRYGGFRSASG
jgi:hypothetical protein